NPKRSDIFMVKINCGTASLIEKYDLHLTGNPKEDLKQMLSA
ncbi:hypothetical protein C5S31_00860, partial [ANME-1 cluster archaeon GoMg2]|nr:hypothetical protein [ANME-1 cluster archaeon GoMg2]